MSQPQRESLTFEESLAELERIVRELEDGKLGLEEALGRYENGVGLLKRCYAQLQQVEQRILQLTGADADGKPLTKTFEHSATADSPKADAKNRRKKENEPEALF
jgi:exodeoxyribonuclease VII small subunit